MLKYILTNYDLCIYPKDLPEGIKNSTVLNKLSFHLGPMMFPLIFPSGDVGWNPMFKQNQDSSKPLTPLQYYLYRLAYNLRTQFSPTL